MIPYSDLKETKEMFENLSVWDKQRFMDEFIFDYNNYEEPDNLGDLLDKYSLSDILSFYTDTEIFFELSEYDMMDWCVRHMNEEDILEKLDFHKIIKYLYKNFDDEFLIENIKVLKKEENHGTSRT
jgi:hypothetical protein